MTDLIYHDPSDRTGISPFDKAIHRIVEGSEVLIACPYIGLDYLNGIIEKAKDWLLLTDIGEWLSIHDREGQKRIHEFLIDQRGQVRHVPDLHAKVVLGDDQALVGSANLTAKGLTGRSEMAVLLDEKDTIDEITEWFETLWSIYDPPELNQIEAYIESTSGTPDPVQKRSNVIFSSDQSPGTASLSESSGSGTLAENEHEEGQADLIEDADKIPSPVYDDMPSIRRVTKFKTKTDQEYYNQLISENENQVNHIRRIIREEGEITKEELKKELKERLDVDISGSFDADLRVLWRSTEEVKPKKPRGDNAVLRWVGE